MTLPPFPDPLLLDEPDLATEVLVPGGDAPAAATPPPGDAVPVASPATPPAARPTPPAATAAVAATGPSDDAPVAPYPHPAPPPEDAFPTLAELDAILAAHAGPPSGPDATTRQEVAAWLGLDPVLAADPAGFDAALAAVPTPDADATLLAWLSDAGEAAAFQEWVSTPEDWPLG